MARASAEKKLKDSTGYEFIEIVGAREHNLKNISLSFPRNKMVVITGISGSGKSSWLSTPFMLKGSAGTWKVFPPMPEVSWATWSGPM